MPDNKNLFDFGTGSIDKDQWLRDIDSKQEEFISMYGSAANKHKTTLLRQAFQDLRRRIATGDMLNRTADGQYQFGSALNREDKHMQEAYQRALGFMGKLARTQIKAPTPLEEKKYGTTTLQQNWLKYLNPSGKFNEKAYWTEGDDASRIAEIKKFLEQEKNGLGAYTGYEGYKDRADLESRIQAFLDSPTERNLQRLGFDNRNWITKPVEEVPEEEPKSELQQVQEQIAAQQEAQKVQQGRQYLNYNNNKGVYEYALTPSTYNFDQALQNNLDLNRFQYSGPVVTFNPGFERRSRERIANDFVSQQQKELDNYFSTFATGWKGIYDLGDENRNRMSNYLARLFSTYNTKDDAGNPIQKSAFNWQKYFTQIGDNQYLINGSIDNSTGRYAFYVPGQGIKEANLLDTGNPYIAQQLNYTIPSQKEGGKIEFLQQGGGFNFSEWDEVNNPKPVQKPAPKKEIKEENSQFSNSETARIAATIADITSMGAAFVPGYGTAASAVLGLGSTATNFGADLADGSGLWNATKNAGFGLAADVMGLIPGLGGVGKGAKIARNLMWAVPKMMQWVNTANGLANAGEIKNSIMKLTSPSSMSVQDWQNVSQALQIMTGHGRSIATKVKKAGMTKTTTTTEPEHYIYTNKGKQKVSDETFKKLREVKGTKARQALTEELMGQGVNLNQTRFAPWNTSTRFGAFKEVPGRTTMEVQNKHKGWFSDENLVQKAENANPSVDIRGILTRINPYKAYYSGRNQPVIPDKNYSRLSIFPADSPLNIHNTTPKVQPHPTGEKYAARPTEQPKVQPKVQSKKKHKRRKHEIGGILYALRNGGIIKAQEGTEFPGLSTNYKTFSDWGNLNWGTGNNLNFNGYMTAGKDRRNGITWSKGLWMDTSEGNYGNQNMQSAYDAQQNYYDQNNGNNIMGDVKKYYATWVQNNAGKDVNAFIQDYNSKVDELRNLNKTKTTAQANSTGWTKFNELHHTLYPSYGVQADGSDDWSDKLKDILGESTWRRVPNTFKSIGELQDKRSTTLVDGDPKWQVAMDNQGHLITDNVVNPAGDITESGKNLAPSSQSKVEDTEGDRDTVVTNKLKSPFDPTPFIVAGKTIQGLLGNRNIYQNLLDEMPQAPLRDPIDRKLAIVGWQERIKNGQNELADLRRVQQRQQGVDQQTNFATALETERVGRDIMDKAFMEDSGRQFETAQKSWNIDNEDYLYNIKVGDDNRKAIADRTRMMAQIRAAWRSGNNNILMGALADTGNWLMKKYQREQDLVDKAKEIQLGSPEERAQSDLYENDPKYATLMDKYQSGQALTDEERAYVKAAQAKALRNIRGSYSQAYYNTYHTPWFGGGYKAVLEVKNGTKLEIAKLKARGRDNDRYVSMIKDLRPSRRRRRR